MDLLVRSVITIGTKGKRVIMSREKRMNKKQKQQAILKALAGKGYTWEVLSHSKSGPNHIRVERFGDVWPSTGTYNKDGKWHKKDFEGLMAILTGGPIAKTPEPPKSHGQRITDLEEYVQELHGIIEDMKFRLNI